MISSRYVGVVCVLVAATLVPTFIHSYADSTLVDGRTTESIPTLLAGYQSSPSGRSATWGQRRFDSSDWTERIYRSAVDEVTLSVIRSYDAKTLYHHPELAVAEGPSWVRMEVRRFIQRAEIPVHVLSTDDGQAVAMYVLHYDHGFVEDPIRFQLRTAGELLFSARKSMTLFFLTDGRVAAGGDVAALPSVALLFEAIDRFVARGT